MKYAVFSVSLPEWQPAEALAHLQAAGYHGIEWRITDQQPANPPGFWAGNHCTWPLGSLLSDAPQIKALCEQHGLAMPSLGTYVSCENLAAVEVAMQGAVQLGVPQLRVGVPNYNGSDPYLPLRERAQQQYRQVEQLAAKYGVRALIELHMGNITPSASAAASFLTGFDPQHVGVIHDAGNMVYEGYEQYRMGLELLESFLAHVHIKNTAWRITEQRADGSTHWRAEFAPITKGVVDMRALLTALHAVGYDRWLSFEDFSTEQPLTERITNNLAYIKGLWEEITG
jgi:sugar phosphate isomerase/epimerase